MESVKGLKKLITVLEKIPPQLQGDVEDIVEARAQTLERDAKRDAPKDTGFLARTIATSVPIDSKGNKLTRVVTANAPYAVYVEHGKPVGTGPNGGPKPFLYPNFFRQRRLMTQDLKDLLKSVFGKI